MSPFGHPLDDDDDWWTKCDLPPANAVVDTEPPPSDSDEPPVPWPGASILLLAGQSLCQPGRRRADDDSAPVPLEHSWVGSLSSTELVAALKDLQGLRSWVDGLTHQALARVADLDPTRDMWSREEVAAALRISSMTAGQRMTDAQTLCHDLPHTVDSLLAGRITSGHASAVLETAASLPDTLVGQLENAVLARAEKQTVGQLRRSLRRVAIKLNPEHAEQARKAAHKERRVRLRPREDGMSDLVATLSAEDAAAIHALVNAAAQQQLIIDRAANEACANEGSPLRTKDQIRADLLVDLILGALDPADLPTQQGRRPVINIHVGLDTLLERDNEHAWLDGYGPVTADVARRLAADQTGTWRRLITDPATRRLLDYDVTKCTPARPVAEHVMTKRPTCSFTGCARPAQESDLDHANPHGSGGRTAGENLQPLCRRHHRAKHEGGWQVRLARDGAANWTSPHGRRYRTWPADRLGPEPEYLSDGLPDPPEDRAPF